MARITIISLGTRGDVQPYIALGSGLQAVGHQVRVVTHENFQPMVTHYGLDYEPISGDAQALVTGQAGLHTLDGGTNPLLVMNRLADAAAPIMRQVIQEIISGLHDTDLALGSALGYSAGYLPATRLGIPIYPAYVQPGSPTAVYPNPFFPTLFNQTVLAGLYNRLTHRVFQLVLNQVGRRMAANNPIPKTGEISDRRDTMDVRQNFGSAGYPGQLFLYGFSPQLVPKPWDWGANQHITGYWYLDQQRDWQPSIDLMRFLDAGSPPIYVGFGSMSSRHPEVIADIVIKAIQATGQRAIMLTGWGGLDPRSLPAEIMVTQSVPHDWLFPRMAALVHHGGSGTTGEALRAGRPQIVIPFSFDQPFWAQRVKAIGVGIAIARNRLSSERLAASLDRTLADQAMRDRAALTGAAVNTENGVKQAVNLLDALLNA